MDCYTGYETPQAFLAAPVEPVAPPEPIRPRIDLRSLITRDWNAEYQVQPFVNFSYL